MLEATDLITMLANCVIADVKRVVFRDTYLDRLKEFVPAGENPTYPDILVSLRVLQQSLERFGKVLSDEQEFLSTIIPDIEIVSAALEVAKKDEEDFATNEDDSEGDEELEADDDSEEENDDSNEEEDDGEEDDEDDEDGEDEEDAAVDAPEEEEEEADEQYHETVRKDEVRSKLGNRQLSNSWFRGYDDGNRYFDFAKLDRDGVPTYTPPSKGITYVSNIQ